MENELEKFIQTNLDDLDRKKPDAVVLGRILQQMQANQKNKPRGILVSFRTLKWAAACILLIACSVTVWQLQKPSQAIAVIKTNTPPPREIKQPVNDSVKPVGIGVVDEDLAVRKAILVLKIKGQKQVIFAGLNNMESAAGRINAVSEAAKHKNNGNDVVDALLKILNSDPNANVRLAALDGLTQFYKEDYVRKRLVASVKKQKDPVVQITLIGLLTRMKESAILAELEKMVKDENTIKAVKDCAYSSILQLRS